MYLRTDVSVEVRSYYFASQFGAPSLGNYQPQHGSGCARHGRCLPCAILKYFRRYHAEQTKGFLVNRAVDRGGDYSDYRRYRHPQPVAIEDRRQSGFGGWLAAYVEHILHRLFHELWPISGAGHAPGPDRL